MIAHFAKLEWKNGFNVRRNGALASAIAFLCRLQTERFLIISLFFRLKKKEYVF